MEISNIIDLVNTTAFPIVAFLITVYGLKYSYDKSLEMNKTNIEQLSELTKAVNNNTTVLTELVKEVEKIS